MSSEALVSGVKEQALAVRPFSSAREELLLALAYIDLRVRWAVARARLTGLDPTDEFRGLYINDTQVDELLAQDLGGHPWTEKNGQHPELADWPKVIGQARDVWQERTAASVVAGQTLLLNDLVRDFDLSPTEVDMLLIALSAEIDLRYERLFAYLQDDVTKKRPSVDLILKLISDDFQQRLGLRHLLTDDARLIQSRLLVRFADSSLREPPLLNHFIRPSARVVEHLLGFPGLDSRLAGAADLAFSHSLEFCPRLPETLLERLREALVRDDNGFYPVFAFRGRYGVGKRAAAHYMAQLLNIPLLQLDLEALGNSDLGLREGVEVALRDARLLNAVLYLAGWDEVLVDDQPPLALFEELMAYPGAVVLAGEAIWQPIGEERHRRILRVAFDDSDYEHRLAVWRHYLGQSELPLLELANQFRFTPGQISDAVATARDMAQWHNRDVETVDLFAASRAHSNQKLGALATKITPRYRWQDIILPQDSLLQLREMVNTVRQRPLVYGKWGFGRKQALGKGLSALFAGESGTGKTMAADILAGELNQDLYKIDLSMLVSKYIGETEKNLNRVFTEAATSNAILFFDEADAIFGKRSEVKDSHDRYANLEISYLLQRMETYDGVVILATNMRSNLDEAFTRRLHFIVEFPFPEARDRELIWQVNFPKQTPQAADIDFALLARLFRLAGGNIRNIIMAAAFLAAESEQPVGMRQLLHATRREYQKLGRLIDEKQFELEAAPDPAAT
jgi:hypothetical protein